MWIEMLLMPEIGRDQGLEMNSDKNLDTIRSSVAIPGLHIQWGQTKIQPRCMSSSSSWCCLDLPVIIDAVCVQLAASGQDKTFKANINVYHTFGTPGHDTFSILMSTFYILMTFPGSKISCASVCVVSVYHDAEVWHITILAGLLKPLIINFVS